MHSFKHILRFLSCLSWTKVVNFILLFGSFRLSRFLKRSVHAGMPISLAVEPANACNLHCISCPIGNAELNRAGGMMSLDVFQSIIDQTYKTLVSVTLYFQGEPFMNQQLHEFVAYAKKHKVYTVVSTNGHFLSEAVCRRMIDAGLDKLIISLDGLDEQSYSAYRVGGKLEKVLQGIETIVAIKQKETVAHPDVTLQTLVLRTNEQQLDKIRTFAKQSGANHLLFKTAQFYNYEAGDPLMPVTSKYARYKKNNQGVFVLKNKIRNRCWRMWSSCVFTWDGFVVPCCFDKDAIHKKGNIQDVPFYTIWTSDAYRQFRTKILNARRSISMCNNCTA